MISRVQNSAFCKADVKLKEYQIAVFTVKRFSLLIWALILFQNFRWRLCKAELSTKIIFEIIHRVICIGGGSCLLLLPFIGSFRLFGSSFWCIIEKILWWFSEALTTWYVPKNDLH